MSIVNLIVYNAKVLTLDHDGTEVEAFAATDGRIVAMGPSRRIKMMAYPGTRMLDAKGATVIPGFIDVHAHLELLTYATEIAVGCWTPPCRTIEDILDRLRERAETTPKGEWILGQGSHMQDSLLEDRRYPDRLDYDRVSTEHPILVRHSGHVQIFNTLGLERVGIARDSPDPRGGRFEHDEAGELTGRTYDVGLTTNKAIALPEWPFEVVRAGIKKVALERYVANGVTTLADLQMQKHGTNALIDMYRQGDLPLRIANYLTIPTTINREDAVKGEGQAQLEGIDPAWIRWGGIKLFLDGGLTAASAAMHEPYEHLPGYRGEMAYEPEEFADLVRDLDEAGHQILVHSIGDRAIDTALDAFAKLPPRPAEIGAHRLEHTGQLFMTKERIARFKEAGVMPLPQPGFIYTLASSAKRYLGDRAKNSYPFRTLLREGFPVAGSSDAGGSDPRMSNPFFAMWLLVNRHTAEGEQLDMSESITVDDALRMYTINGALALGDSKNIGSLEVGKYADFVVLEDDPRSVATEKLADIKPLMTWVGGLLKHGEAPKLI